MVMVYCTISIVVGFITMTCAILWAEYQRQKHVDVLLLNCVNYEMLPDRYLANAEITHMR